MSYEITDAKTNKLIATIKTMANVGYKGESKVTRYPVEKGGFFSANKVASPYSLPITVVIAGNSQQLSQSLADLQKYEASTDLVNVTLPFRTFLDANIETLNWNMRENGPTSMLEVQLTLVEIRQVNSSYTAVSVQQGAPKPKKTADVKNKSDASTQDNGKQQGQPPRKSVLGGWLGK